MLIGVVLAALAGCSGDASQAPPPQLAAQVTSRSASDYYPALQAIYVADFGRPADPAGMAWHANNLLAAGAPTTVAGLLQAYQSSVAVRAVIDAFGNSAEYNALYAGDDDRFVTAIYQSLFNRVPDDAGKQWWLNAIRSGSMSRTQAALTILSSARDSDVDRIAIKTREAAAFTDALGGELQRMAYDGLDANVLARTMLAGAQPGRDDAALAKSVSDTVAQLVQQSGAGFHWDIAANVPPDQAAIVKGAAVLAQTFIDSKLGGGLPAAVRTATTFKVVASGLGNQELGGGGSCCTALAVGPGGSSQLRPFIDVKHSDWDRPADSSVYAHWTQLADHQKVVVHEYTHAWQSSLGCLSISVQPLGFWINEGLAEFVANEAMFAQGSMSRADVRQFMLQSADYTGELGMPLRQLGGTSAAVWPGHIGYLAIDYLVGRAPAGIGAVRILCEQVAAGATTAAAFRTAFGVDMDSFYTDFEALRPQLVIQARQGG
ncbi:hypothetical protein GCM10027321_04930 [Massilia terrae]|uniref:DUF4214 domain-containing protein n=1 Tax=Massilia terrae TaxID=1811224 RepID=A0ABT2CT50_9BURK|nr:DUF4214 domain-containing protein [Massilia terrae]MCS0657146.1 DUF4214 domain-containing protein [Massilia terrae]